MANLEKKFVEPRRSGEKEGSGKDRSEKIGEKKKKSNKEVQKSMKGINRNRDLWEDGSEESAVQSSGKSGSSSKSGDSNGKKNSKQKNEKIDPEKKPTLFAFADSEGDDSSRSNHGSKEGSNGAKFSRSALGY